MQVKRQERGTGAEKEKREKRAPLRKTAIPETRASWCKVSRGDDREGRGEVGGGSRGLRDC